MLTCSIAFLYFMILHPPIFTLTYTLFPYATLFRSVWISGQVRRVTKPIRREMKRRAAIEPVIGQIKAEHRMGRNYLKGHAGDRANALLAAAGYNFSLLLRWLAELLRALMTALLESVASRTRTA